MSSSSDWRPAAPAPRPPRHPRGRPPERCRALAGMAVPRRGDGRWLRAAERSGRTIRRQATSHATSRHDRGRGPRPGDDPAEGERPTTTAPTSRTGRARGGGDGRPRPRPRGVRRARRRRSAAPRTGSGCCPAAADGLVDTVGHRRGRGRGSTTRRRRASDGRPRARGGPAPASCARSARRSGCGRRRRGGCSALGTRYTAQATARATKIRRWVHGSEVRFARTRMGRMSTGVSRNNSCDSCDGWDEPRPAARPPATPRR